MMAETPRKTGKVRLIVITAAVVVTLILVFQNTETVETQILFGKVPMPRALLLAITAGIGFVGGWLLRGGRKH